MKTSKQALRNVDVVINYALAQIVGSERYEVATEPDLNIFGQIIKVLTPDIITDIIDKLHDQKYLEYLKTTFVLNTVEPTRGFVLIFPANGNFVKEHTSVTLELNLDEGQAVRYDHLKNLIKSGEIITILTLLITKLYTLLPSTEQIEEHMRGIMEYHIKVQTQGFRGNVDFVERITHEAIKELRNLYNFRKQVGMFDELLTTLERENIENVTFDYGLCLLKVTDKGKASFIGYLNHFLPMVSKLIGHIGFTKAIDYTITDDGKFKALYNDIDVLIDSPHDLPYLLDCVLSRLIKDEIFTLDEIVNIVGKLNRRIPNLTSQNFDDLKVSLEYLNKCVTGSDKDTSQTEQTSFTEGECEQTPTAETKEVNEMQTKQKELYRSDLPRGMSLEQYDHKVLTTILILGICLNNNSAQILDEERFITLPLLKDILEVAKAMLPECLEDMVNDADDPSVDSYFDTLEPHSGKFGITYPACRGILNYTSVIKIGDDKFKDGIVALMVNHLLYLNKGIIPCERDVFLSNTKKVEYGSDEFIALISDLDLKISTTLDYPWLESKQPTQSEKPPFWMQQGERKQPKGSRRDSSRYSGLKFHRRGNTSNNPVKAYLKEDVAPVINRFEEPKGITGKVYDGLYHSKPTSDFTYETIADVLTIATAILMVVTAHSDHQRRHLPHRRYFTAFLVHLEDICPGIIDDVDIMMGVFKSNDKINPNVRLVDGIIHTEMDNRTLAIDLSREGCGINSLKVVLYLMIYKLIEHGLLTVEELKSITDGEYIPSKFRDPLIPQLLNVVKYAQTFIVDRKLSSCEPTQNQRREAFQNAPEETYKDETTNDTLSMLLSIRAIKTTLVTLTEFNRNEDDLRKCMANSQQLFQNFNQLFKGYIFKRINFEANESTLTIIGNNFGIRGLVAEIMDILNECDTTLGRSHQVELILLKLIKLYPLYSMLSSCVYP